MKVKDIMSTDVVTASEDDRVERIIETMKDRKVGCVLIVNAKGKLAGIVTNSDLIPRQHRGPFRASGWAYLFGLPFLRKDIEEIYQSVKEKPAREVMKSPVVAVTEDDEVELAVKVMMSNVVDHVPVVREDRPVGMVSRRNLMSVMV